MHILSWGVALIGGLASGLLVLGAVRAPLRSSMLPRASAPTVIRTTTSHAAQEWSFQIDEAALSKQNAWAAGQPTVQTRLGMARLQDMTVALRDNQIGLRGSAEARWVRPMGYRPTRVRKLGPHE
jgi:hypothetical protein